MAEVKLTIVGDNRAEPAIKSATAGIKEVGTASTVTKSAVDTLRTAFTALSAAFVGVGFGVAVRAIAQAGMEAERLRNAMNAAAGSAASGAAELAFVRAEANRLGLDITATADSFTKLAASARGTALEGQATREIFSAVSEASTVLGLSAEQTNGALYSIAQMMSKGNVQAEELRGQLGERLPGAFNLAAKAMKMTTAELNKALENGEVLATDLLPKLAEELHKTFGSKLEDAVKSTRAEVNRMKTAFFELKVMLGEGDVFKNMARAAASSIDALKTVVKWIGQAKVYWQGFAEKVGAAWEGLKGIFRGDKNALAEMKAQFKTIDEHVQFYWNKWEQRSNQTVVAPPTMLTPGPSSVAKPDMKELTKQFKERAKEIIEVEKERIKTLIDLEGEYLQKMKSSFQEQLDKITAFKSALKEVTASWEERESARRDTLRGPEDYYTKQARLMSELAEKERKLNESWADPAAKIKGLNDLIPKYRELFQEHKDGEAIIISQTQADRDFQIAQDRIKEAILSVADEMKGQEDALVSTAEAMIAAEDRVKSYKQQVQDLDTMIRNLPHLKDINVNLKVNGIQDLYQVSGLMKNTGANNGITSYGDHYTQNGSIFWNSGEYAGKTSDFGDYFSSLPGAATGGHIVKGGLLRVHDDEDIVPAKIDRSANVGGSTSVQFNGDMQFVLPNVTNQSTVDDLARQAIPKLMEYMRTRLRAA